MKTQIEIVHSYDTIKNDFDKVWQEKNIFKTDTDQHDILDKNFDYEIFIDEQIKFKTEEKRFETDFLFKDYNDLLVNHYTNCGKRMKNSDKIPPKMANYCRIIMTFLKNN